MNLNNILKITRKDGVEVEVELKELDLSYLDKIMDLQKIIIDGLENKELYADTEREEFEEYDCHGNIIYEREWKNNWICYGKG